MTDGEHVLRLTRELIAMRTTSGDGNEEQCAVYLGQLLRDAGFQVDFDSIGPGRQSLVAYLGDDSGPPLCLTGHLDTVPVGDAAWDCDPFAGEIHDGRIVGRGASDMKGGVAALVVAAIRSASRLSQCPGISVILTASEETGCQGAASVMRSGLNSRGAGAILVAEPTANQPVLGHKGALWLELGVTGVGAHGSMPELGENAVYKAAALVTRLQKYRFQHPAHPALGAPTLNVGTFVGGSSINIVPDSAVVGIDIRTIPGMEHGAVQRELSAYLGSSGFTLRQTLNLPSVWNAERHPWTHALFELLDEYQDREAEALGASYFTDACVFSPANARAPTIILGPGEPGQAHKTNEYCHVEKIREAVDIYCDVIESWRAGADEFLAGFNDRRFS
jgi:succinyl-diaminopimelate desuccinylase